MAFTCAGWRTRPRNIDETIAQAQAAAVRAVALLAKKELNRHTDYRHREPAAVLGLRVVRGGLSLQRPPAGTWNGLCRSGRCVMPGLRRLRGSLPQQGQPAKRL
jgi:hypothetical protein